jgi:hypothetical protein
MIISTDFDTILIAAKMHDIIIENQEFFIEMVEFLSNNYPRRFTITLNLRTRMPYVIANDGERSLSITSTMGIDGNPMYFISEYHNVVLKYSFKINSTIFNLINDWFRDPEWKLDGRYKVSNIINGKE